MTLNDLYKEAEDKNIGVYYTDCPKSGSISLLLERGKCFIGIDRKAKESEREQIVRMAHEIGHCETGAFYNRYSNLDSIEKHEYKANKWAIETLIPEEEMLKAYNKDLTECYELSEYFDLPEPFVMMAMDYYTNKIKRTNLKPHLKSSSK